MSAPPAELGLYLHLPFCAARCPYCDFAARPYRPAEFALVAAAIPRHLALLAPLAGGRRLASLYLGGGTPAMLPAGFLAGLIAAAGRELGLLPGAEVSLEANPGGVSPGKLAALRAAGVNRLSLGVQSFAPPLLAALGRRHGPAATARAVAAARAAGFANLNLDLIYGLPGQDLALFRADLAAALALGPEHLSLYELTLSPETPFGHRYRKGLPPLPAEETVLAMEELAQERLPAAGLERYEVSNFARPGAECRHNQATWRGADYLALGPGAHGHLAGRRWANLAEPAAYAAALAAGKAPHQFAERLTPRQRALELCMLGLRTVEGVDLAAVAAVLGRDPREAYAPALAELAELGWARLAGGRLVPTPRGLRMADAAAARFVA